MSFNENLREVMNSLDITTKELAALTNLKEDTINSYLKTNGAMPTADKAVSIAQALHTSVEFLVTGFEKDNNGLQKIDLRKYYKYTRTITNLDLIPETTRKPVIEMIENLSVASSEKN